MVRRKGQLVWLVLALGVLLTVIVALSGPTQEAFNEAIRTSSRLYAREIAGIINMLQAAPDGTQHSYTLPAIDCAIDIGSNVLVTVKTPDKEESFESDLIKTGVKVEKARFSCSKDAKLTLRFTKENGIITVV